MSGLKLQDPIVQGGNLTVRQKCDNTCFGGQKLPVSVFRQNRHNGSLHRAARDLHLAVCMNVNVDFTANTEFREINARLNGEQTSWQNPAGFVSFQVVHVRAVAMDFLGQAVPRSVAEVRSVSSRFDDTPHGIIHFPALNRTSFGERGPDAGNPRISSGGDNPEHLREFVGHGFTDVARSREITVNGAGFVLFGPQIDQHKTAFNDSGIRPRSGFVMRVTAVAIDTDDWRMVRSQLVFGEMPHDLIRYRHLFDKSLSSHLISDEFPDTPISCVCDFRGFEMTLELCLGQRRFEERDQIAGRNNFRAKRSHKFDRAGIDSRNIRIRIAWRVFHRDVFVPRDNVLHARFQFLPAQVDDFVAGQMVQRIGFNAVNKLFGAPVAGMK